MEGPLGRERTEAAENEIKASFTILLSQWEKEKQS